MPSLRGKRDPAAALGRLSIMRHLLSPILAFALASAGAGAMIFFFAAGWGGWTVMAAGLALTTGALWLYSDFDRATAHR